ncbi:VanZ family protein [Streptomyces sp. AM6-12]|uniref:VanZ family protein n=1 Tax=Streptomyces sp. AM6-12 TaxID=3345149 RepID=UPI0037A64D58
MHSRRPRGCPHPLTGHRAPLAQGTVWAAAALEARARDAVPRLSRVLLALCLAIVFAATLLPTQPLDSGGPRSISWMPGEGLWDDGLSSTGAMEHEMVLRLQLANALMFVPLGILLLFSTRRPHLARTTAVCLALSVSIEAAQYAMNAGRTVDVDDVPAGSRTRNLGPVARSSTPGARSPIG